MTEPTKVWMPPQPAKLERLARELETQPNAEALKKLITFVRDNDFDRYKLIQELRMARLGYFAKKLEIGWYELNR